MNRRNCFLLRLLLCCLPLTTPASAGEESLEELLDGFEKAPGPNSMGPALDDVLEGFEETTVTERPPTDPRSGLASDWRVSGAIDFSTAFNFAHKQPAPDEADFRGLSRLRTSLDLELDGDLTPGWRLHLGLHGDYDAIYQVNGRDQYRSPLLDESENEVEVGEFYLQGSPAADLDLKLGRQILVWGKSDNLRVTDILNPLDMREPGIVDIEDLRLPVGMARLDYFREDWSFSLIAIPEVRFSKLPPYGSDFYQGSAAPPAERVPGDGFGNLQYALAANGIFSGWDLAFYWADLYQDQAYLAPNGGVPERRHSRITMAGSATNVALGNWLLKGEFAYLNGLRFNNLPGVKRERADLLVGVEYSGFDNTTLSLERAVRRLSGFNDELAAAGYAEHQWQTALRYQGEFLNARLKLTALATFYGASLNQGGFLRLSGDYELAEAQILTLGVIFYENGESPPVFGIGDNDRLFASYRYSF
ncbi:MAG: hypothetical protein KDI83_15485 [Gammaproteobacteria bacterium]|nr:hypothetical protein [Gammaproteobacteria bacterium]